METGAFTCRLVVTLLLVALALFLVRIVDVLLLAFAAVLVAVLLRGLADWIGRPLRLSQGWALAAAVAMLLVVVGASSWVFGREVSAQIDQLKQILPEAWDRLRERLQSHVWGRAVIEQVRALDARVVSEGVVSNFGSLVATTLGALGNLLLVLAGGVFLSIQPGLYRDGMLALVPRGAEHRARKALAATGHALARWLKGQVIAMATIGILTALRWPPHPGQSVKLGSP